MCKELDEERERGNRAVRDLVEHATAMSTARIVAPASTTREDGALLEWRVTVELVSVIQP